MKNRYNILYRNEVITTKKRIREVCANIAKANEKCVIVKDEIDVNFLLSVFALNATMVPKCMGKQLHHIEANRKCRTLGFHLVFDDGSDEDISYWKIDVKEETRMRNDILNACRKADEYRVEAVKCQTPAYFVCPLDRTTIVKNLVDVNYHHAWKQNHIRDNKDAVACIVDEWIAERGLDYLYGFINNPVGCKTPDTYFTNSDIVNEIREILRKQTDVVAVSKVGHKAFHNS